MSKFKVGDRICEISNKSPTGTEDIGIITEKHATFENHWWVLWESGNFKGRELHINENSIEHVNNKGSMFDLHDTEIVIAGITYILKRK